jgi:hypothetical protein
MPDLSLERREPIFMTEISMGIEEMDVKSPDNILRKQKYNTKPVVVSTTL